MEIAIDAKNIKKSIRRLKKEFTSPKGSIQTNVRRAAQMLITRAVSRYRKNFPSRGKGPDVISAIRASGYELITNPAGDIGIMMFDADVLDKNTELSPTLSGGNIFHLWRLLHDGWTGSNSPGFTSDGYPLFVILQLSTLGQNIGFPPGRYAPFPELLTLEGNAFVQVVRHPGFSGKEWFLRNGAIFIEDRKLVEGLLNQSIKQAVKRAGLNK